jgi:hypothetical protein
MHYKSFEELYGKETTENHRPSLKNTKMKMKGKMVSTRIKHTMPFYPSAARAKNVSITVCFIECEKSRLLFSAKKLTEKDKTILRSFLETIFYTCGMSFHNVCDLAMAVSPKQPDDDTENNHEEADNQDIDDDNEMNRTNLKIQILRMKNLKIMRKSLRKKNPGKKSMRKRSILFVKYFQESLLMTRGPALRKLRNYTTWLEFIWTFVSNAEVLKLLKLQKVNSHIAMFVVAILMFQKNV